MCALILLNYFSLGCCAMQFYLTNAFFPWNQQDQVNLSQNTCTSSPKTPPCPYALHLLTSFKPLLGPFEPRLWTQPPPKKTHTPQWSHPTTHRHLPNLGLMLLGDAILLTAICMTRRFRSEEGRRAGAPLTPGSKKKKKRNETWGAR